MKTFSKTAGHEALRSVACALCGSDAARRFYDESSLWVRCSGCGLVYQNPQPVRDELLDRYDREYFQYEVENETTFLGLMKKGLADVGFEAIEAGLDGEKRIVDIGCATGMLIASMKERGWIEKGVEVCGPAVEYARTKRGVDIFEGILEEAGIAGSTIDVVHCSHLIEHLNDPLGFVLEAKRILKPGGYFIVTTPNVMGFQARLFRTGWRSMIADHLYLFSKATLIALVQKAGFEVLTHKTWGGLAIGTAPGWIKGPVDRLAKAWGFGDVVIVLARKPK